MVATMGEMTSPKLRLVTFPPAWGLPTAGPFGLKLEACLRMLDVPYAIAFGLLAVSIRSPLPTPVCTYARSMNNLVAFVDRALARWFPENAGAVPSPAVARSVA